MKEKMKAVLAICVIALANANTILPRHKEFQDFKLTQGKAYGSEQEERLRLEIFSKNLQEIEEHNSRYERGLETWYMGENQFTDMTAEEFTRYLTKQGPPPSIGNPTVFTGAPEPTPDAIDWRQRGIVTEVKQQGSCGASWSFSVTGAIESAYAKFTGHLVSLSEQHLVDCVVSNSGCDGGSTPKAYEYVIRNGGIASEADYPYVGARGECQEKMPPAVEISNFGEVLQTEANLQVVVGVKGPASVAVDGTYLRSYKGGVFYDRRCRSYGPNHALLAVGYGRGEGDRQHEYWILKNSWGTEWGEAGYMRLLRNYNNHCGIACNATFPFIEGP